MKAYKEIVANIIENGHKKSNRTGVDTLVVAGVMFEHDMADGFPLLTTKYVPFRLVASELEFFIQGRTDKQWLIDNQNHIWDFWCNPKRVAYGHDEETKAKMKAETDLGPIYGFQWRHFGGAYHFNSPQSLFGDKGYDQLANIVKTLKTNPDDRRMIVSAWNPVDLDQMALPPCHYGFQVTVINGKLNLLWNQRSVDVALGLPFNIASYGLLLLLLCKETGFQPGRLIGFLADTHIYENHIQGLLDQINRSVYTLPRVTFKKFTSIFDWSYKDMELYAYKHHSAISFDIAV